MASSAAIMTPHQVVEKMSFQTQPKQKEQFSPVAPPPSAAPPPPPPSDSDENSVRTVEDNTTAAAAAASSYQNSGGMTRPAQIPVITNFGDDLEAGPNTKGRKWVGGIGRGDPTLRPNTGQTNDDYGGIGSLNEIATILRWMTIVSSSIAILWEGFALPTRILIHSWVYPAKVVLGGYLGVFCILLLGVELNAPLRDNFGILYHPLGRAVLLFLMSGMCFGILFTWWEILLGLAFILCGSGYVYAYIMYPEYRRWQSYSDNKVWEEAKTAARASIAWANPNGSVPVPDVSNWNTVANEQQSLLTKV
jgi:hypothetical protein